MSFSYVELPEMMRTVDGMAATIDLAPTGHATNFSYYWLPIFETSAGALCSATIMSLSNCGRLGELLRKRMAGEAGWRFVESGFFGNDWAGE